jgi:hypothetical protein
MEADEPIVPWWLGIVLGLIAWVPWTIAAYFVAVGAGFRHAPSWVLAAVFLLPTVVIGLLLGRTGPPTRLRSPADPAALLLTAAWFVGAVVLWTSV